MARELDQLLPTAYPDLEVGHLDILFLHSQLRLPGGKGTPNAADSLCCVLVSASTAPGAAAALAAAAPAFCNVHATCVRVPAARLAETLAQQVSDRQFTLVGAVLLLDDARFEVAVAQSVVDELRWRNRSGSAVVAAVSSQPARWGALKEVDGFVGTRGQPAVRAAVSLFCALATSCAPMLWSALDEEAVRLSLGPAFNPSRLIEAVWQESAGRLVLVNDADQLSLDSAARVVAFVFPSGGSIRIGLRVLKALEEVTPFNAERECQVAVQFVVPQWSGSSWVSVAFLI